MITSTLRVLMWDKEIGRLSWDAKRGVAFFEYSSEFLNGTLDAFPLIASVKSPASRRPVMGNRETALYRKLPPFLADSLPDAWGNRVFECWRIENGIRNQEITPLDMLSFIGKRGMGALEFVPETSGVKMNEKLELAALTELAQRIYVEREDIRILPEDSLTMKSLMAVGTSAGGRQPKAIIAINCETGEVRSGQVAGHKDFEYCILKFGDAERSSAELEMAYCEMAIAAGIEMSPSRLIEVEGKSHFITKRFDRDGNRKLHMQTLAALYPDADSYESLLMVCRKMRLPESTQEEVFRRMVFNILANNTDDHNKNFSFLMDEEERWRLSPAYDMTFIFNIGGFMPEKMHCLMMRGKLTGHKHDEALTLARENGIKNAEVIIRQVADAISRFRYFAERYNVRERWISAVESCLSVHLAEWELESTPRIGVTIVVNGKTYSDVHLEQAYKGNYHLLASVDGRQVKYVISKNKAEYEMIDRVGMTNVSPDLLAELVDKGFGGE